MRTQNPETRYARSGSVHIAYQVFGEHPRDVIVVARWLSHQEVFWEEPEMARGFRRLASFARVISFDKRGAGLSDRVPESELPTLQERMDDLRSVMDAVGSRKATLIAIHEAGPMSMLFAATHPERTEGLVLYGTWPKGTRSDDYPWAPPAEYHERVREAIGTRWGTGMGVRIMAPSRLDDQRFREWWGKYERQGASPGAALISAQISADTDVRHLLPSIRVPTLVLHRTGDRVADVRGARWMAQQIPNARMVELSGDDHWWGVDPDQLIDPIEEFVTGVRPSPTPVDRILATVLFSDIGDSTAKVSELGDRAWKRLLERHDQVVRGELDRFRGREIKTTGDGFLALFDGPGRAVFCAKEIVDATRQLGLDVRIGVHTGEVELRADDVAGIAVHIGQRVSAVAAPGEILVSRTVVDLVAGSGLQFEPRGSHELSGVAGEWQVFAVRT